MNELKTKVRTEGLQNELATVQAELLTTQKALMPPKAKLAFTFVPFINPVFHEGQPVAEPMAVKEVSLPLKADGTVHVEFAILNLTHANADNIDITLIICNLCKFAKEPDGFTTLPDGSDSAGTADTRRYAQIPQLHALEAWKATSVDVLLPPTDAPGFNLAIVYRCDTCELDVGPTKGTVHIRRDFVKR